MEVLFKAKRKDNGEWIEGYYIYYACIDTHYIIKNVLVRRWSDGRKPTMSDYGTAQYEIDPETLCRYTGVDDDEDNKIWENDILRGHGNDKDLAKVVFGEFNVIDVETLEVIDSVIGWHTEVIETDAVSLCEPFCLPMPLNDFYINRSEFKVIGNIFDNPELLKEEK